MDPTPNSLKMFCLYLSSHCSPCEAGIIISSFQKPLLPLSPKGNQTWIFSGGTDAEAEAPRLWPVDVKSLLIRKDPDTGKDWRQEEKGMTESEMVGWHHQHEFEQSLGDGEGQGSLVCCSPWGCKESDTTEQWTTSAPTLCTRFCN